jgi:hypothetical protein
VCLRHFAHSSQMFYHGISDPEDALLRFLMDAPPCNRCGAASRTRFTIQWCRPYWLSWTGSIHVEGSSSSAQQTESMPWTELCADLADSTGICAANCALDELPRACMLLTNCPCVSVEVSQNSITQQAGTTRAQ